MSWTFLKIPQLENIFRIFLEFPELFGILKVFKDSFSFFWEFFTIISEFFRYFFLETISNVLEVFKNHSIKRKFSEFFKSFRKTFQGLENFWVVLLNFFKFFSIV